MLSKIKNRKSRLAKRSFSIFDLRFSILVFVLAGCTHHEPVPVYPWQGNAEALRILRARSGAVKTVSAQCSLTLRRADGQTVNLDAAVVMELPGKLRLRAWKLGQAVFDLTVNPDGVWVEGQRKESIPAGAGAADAIKQWAVFMGALFSADDLKTSEQGSGILRIEEGRADGSIVTCDVVRKTLTPRKFLVVDADGKQRFALQLERYRMENGIAWPGRVAGTSEQGQIVLDMNDVELNGDVAPAAFVPPKRAEKL